MPNWCSNSVAISHPDPVRIQLLSEAFANRRLFQSVIPIPPELLQEELSTYGGNDEEARRRDQLREAAMEATGYPNAYDFCISRWGTKWEVGEDDGGSQSICPNDGILRMHFETAWAPPEGIYEELTEQGYDVSAYYYEPGMGFCGSWTSEYGDDYYEIQGDSDWVRENIPQEIDDAMGISAIMEEWEEDAAD